MCLALFIGSDHELQLRAFDPASPGFNVQSLAPREEAVRCQFALPNVVYAGAHTSCSCGFRAEDEADAGKRDEAIDCLVDYLEERPAAAVLELFVCWEGEYEREAVRRLRRTRAELRRPDWIEELTHVRVFP